jgi:hypothetical protein
MKRGLLPVVAALLTFAGVAAAGLISNQKPMTNQEALASLHGHPEVQCIQAPCRQVPVKWRKYALRAYLTGPYKNPALNVEFAISEASTHYKRAYAKKIIKTLALLGRQDLVDQTVKEFSKPRYYGLPDRKIAIAIVRGWVAGAV